MLKVFSYSEAGGHPVNEDAFATRWLTPEQDCLLCALADGQGGRSGGREAAQVAVKVSMEVAVAFPADKLWQPAAWGQILRTADREVRENPAAGFTTLVAFCLNKEILCGASCGDSAALLLQVNQPAKILTDRQFKNPPVGSGVASFIGFAAELQRPWTVLAMSDGVWKFAGWENIFKIGLQEDGQKIAATLRDRAKLQGSGGLQDDFTLVIFQDSSF